MVWVRGCGRRCPGCMATDLWDPGRSTRVEKIAQEILPPLGGLDGLTISGGEPFDQAPAVLGLVRHLREEFDVEIAIYTGYLLPELRALGDERDLLVRQVDILIDGPYEEQANNTLVWRGSDNQEVHLLTARAQQYSAAAHETWPMTRPLQIQPLGTGRYRLVGIPRRGELALYRRAMARRGLEVHPDGNRD